MRDVIAQDGPRAAKGNFGPVRPYEPRPMAAVLIAFTVVSGLMLYLVVADGARLLEDAAATTRAGIAGVVVLLSGLTVWLYARERGHRRAADQDAAGETAALSAEIAAQTGKNVELLRAKEAAEAANAAKTRYLVAVNHEIRSPLNAIYGYAQLLEREQAVAATEAGGVIRRSAEHLANLVESLLEISRIESGTVKLRTEIIQLPTLLDDVMDMFRIQAKVKGLQLHYEIAGRLPRFVRTDEKRVRQILINLLSNAIKYTPKGSVTVSVTYRSQVAEVSIADTGIGIAPDDMERIFEPFERASSPGAVPQPGIGLGLAITRMLARVLGGDIVATSTPGVGSCFKLRMFMPEPLSPPDDPATHGRVVGYRGPRKTVLVVDDQLSQTVVLDGLLRPIGFVVYTAHNGAEGLTLAERCQPDLVLLDIQMPGMSGWEVAARLRATYGQAIRIIMVSADAPELSGSSTGAPPHDAFVSKPVDLEALLIVIGRTLRLSWEVSGHRQPHVVAEQHVPLPASAAKWVEQLRKFAEVGNIRAVEATFGELEANVAEDVPAVAEMRHHINNFDLGALLRMLDDGQQR